MEKRVTAVFFGLSSLSALFFITFYPYGNDDSVYTDSKIVQSELENWIILIVFSWHIFSPTLAIISGLSRLSSSNTFFGDLALFSFNNFSLFFRNSQTVFSFNVGNSFWNTDCNSWTIFNCVLSYFKSLQRWILHISWTMLPFVYCLLNHLNRFCMS